MSGTSAAMVGFLSMVLNIYRLKCRRRVELSPILAGRTGRRRSKRYKVRISLAGRESAEEDIRRSEMSRRDAWCESGANLALGDQVINKKELASRANLP